MEYKFSVLSKKNFHDFLKDLKCNIYPTEFYQSKELLHRICSFRSVMKFRLIMYALEDKIGFTDMYENRYHKYILNALSSGGLNRMYSELINKIGNVPNDKFKCMEYEDLFDGTMFPAFCDKVTNSDDKENLTKFLSMYFNRLATDMISEYLFYDLFNNVLIDCEQLLKYNSKFNLIYPDHIDFYKEFMNLDDLRYSEKIAFFNKYKGKNIKDMFYDDMSILKKHAKTDISSSCIKLDESLVDSRLSKKFGVKVYKYDGDPFRGVFRAANAYREHYNPNLFENMFCQTGYAYSFSFCDSDHFWLYSNPEDKYTFFYDEVSPDEIVHMNRSDSFSEARESVLYVSKYPNELVSSKELLGGTKGYNEIVLKGNGGKIPSAIVLIDTTKKEKEYQKIIDKYGCSDTFYSFSAIRNLEMLQKSRENTIKFAKAYNIPIMYIDSSKYNTTYSGVIDGYECTPSARFGNYITDYSQIEVYNYMGRRK